MKRFSLYSISIVATIIFLFTGCDNSSIVKDNSPPPDSQIRVESQANMQDSTADSTAHNRYIVMYKQQPVGLAGSQAAQLAVEKTNTIFSTLGFSQDSLIHQYKTASFGFAGHFSPEQARLLRNHPLVDHVVKDYYYKAIDDYERDVSLPVAKKLLAFNNQTVPYGVTRVNGPLDGTGKTAWVLDTGVDLDHVDLNVDQSRSTSFLQFEGTEDMSGHGTHVAGIIGTLDNTYGLVGVAAGASIVGVKVCNKDDSCFISDVKAGVEYAANNYSPGDVANMSLGFPSSAEGIPDLENSILAAANSGLKFTLSAGNDSDDANNKSPARIENANVFTVSAFDDNDQFASFSNYGNPPIEYGGPGVSVLSLYKNGGTATLSGTSMAAPHIAGLLLVQPNDVATEGTVSGDPDSNPDPILVAAILEVLIGGDTVLQSGEQGNWQANVKFEEGSVSYQWYYRDTASDPWVATNVTSSTFSHTFFNSGNSANNAQVRVDITSAGETASKILYVLVQANCADPGEIQCQ